jgi:hypothetical protein
MTTATQFSATEWARTNGEAFTYWAPLDRYEPAPRRTAHGLLYTFTYPDGREGLVIDSVDQFRDHTSAVYLIDDGSDVRPFHVAAWSTLATDDYVIALPFPTNDGRVRPDNGRPVDFSNWAVGPTRAYHLKITQALPDDFESTALAAYLTCALWSSTDESDESGGRPLDDNYGPDDIADASVSEAREALRSLALQCVPMIRRQKITAEQFGHDFWLTRNGHGAGFWDRGYGADGQALTDAAKVWGGSDAYVGDDGRVYLT